MGLSKNVVVIFLIVLFRVVHSELDYFAQQEAFKGISKDHVNIDVNMEDTVHALEKVVFYFGKIKKRATVDLAFGMQGVHGELTRILTMEKEGRYSLLTSQANFLTRLKELHVYTKEYIQDSLPYIKLNSREYYKSFYTIIKNPWMPYELPPQVTSINRIDIFPNFTLKALNEDESDVCMQLFLDPNKAQLCNLGDCFNKMTQMGGTFYNPTHQILWLLLGEQAGCRSVLEEEGREMFPGGLDEMLKVKCAGVALEMEALAKKEVAETFRDVFLEQGFICGKLGFMDAVKPAYLLSALKWQNLNTGCYSQSHQDEVERESDESLNEFMFWINMKKEDWRSRNLLVDTFLPDKCSTHMTAVAAGFLAVSLRLFFDPVYKRSQLDEYLKLSPPPQLPQNNPHVFPKIFALCLLVGLALYLKRKYRRVLNFLIALTDDLKGRIKNLKKVDHVV